MPGYRIDEYTHMKYQSVRRGFCFSRLLVSRVWQFVTSRAKNADTLSALKSYNGEAQRDWCHRVWGNMWPQTRLPLRVSAMLSIAMLVVAKVLGAYAAVSDPAIQKCDVTYQVPFAPPIWFPLAFWAHCTLPVSGPFLVLLFVVLWCWPSTMLFLSEAAAALGFDALSDLLSPGHSGPGPKFGKARDETVFDDLPSLEGVHSEPDSDAGSDSDGTMPPAVGTTEHGRFPAVRSKPQHADAPCRDAGGRPSVRLYKDGAAIQAISSPDALRARLRRSQGSLGR